MKDCTTCKYGHEDERFGIPLCHHPKRFSEDCVDFNMHEEKETKESEKPVPADLEEAATNWICNHKNGEILYVKDAFIAGAKWQKEQDEKEQADLFTIVALDAAQRAKEQMMKIITKGDNLEEAGTQYVKAYFRDIDWTPDVIKSCLEEAFISGGEYVFKQIKYE